MHCCCLKTDCSWMESVLIFKLKQTHKISLILSTQVFDRPILQTNKFSAGIYALRLDRKLTRRILHKTELIIISTLGKKEWYKIVDRTQSNSKRERRERIESKSGNFTKIFKECNKEIKTCDTKTKHARKGLTYNIVNEFDTSNTMYCWFKWRQTTVKYVLDVCLFAVNFGYFNHYNLTWLQ